MPWRASPLVYGSTSGANGYGLALHDHGLVHEPRLVRSHLHVPRYCRWAPLAHTQLQQSTLDPVNSECQPRLPTRERCTSFSHTRRSGRYPPGVSSVLTRHAATATKQPASSLPCLDSFGPTKPLYLSHPLPCPMFKCGRFTRRPTDGRAAIFFCLPRLRRRATTTPVSKKRKKENRHAKRGMGRG